MNERQISKIDSWLLMAGLVLMLIGNWIPNDHASEQYTFGLGLIFRSMLILTGNLWYEFRSRIVTYRKKNGRANA